MGSARDSVPDPNHTSGMARSSVSMRLQSRPPSAPASVSPSQSPHAISPAVDQVTPRATGSTNGSRPANSPSCWTAWASPCAPITTVRGMSRASGIRCCSKPGRSRCGSISFACVRSISRTWSWDIAAAPPLGTPGNVRCNVPHNTSTP